MLSLLIDEPGFAPRRVELIAPLTAIGGRVGYREATVPLESQRQSVLWIYRDARGYTAAATEETGVLRNGVRMKGFDSCLAGDTFSCGAATFTVERARALDSGELARLTVLAKAGAPARAVFIDELEAAGRVDEAAYVRGFARWSERGTISARAELEVLAAKLEPRFRAQVVDVAIERCARPACPKRWSQLEPLPHPRERHCAVCNAVVPFCDTLEEAKTFAHHARALVVEPGRHRSHDDLEPDFVIG